MATLVSPGVSVTIIDQSFFIPASASTVPLFIVASQAGKMQPDGITAASGTNEHGVVRTVTSVGQSVQLYGTPHFWQDSSGNPFHGDARNEYGLLALNEFLGVGNLSYVVRANVDLTDATIQFVGTGNIGVDTPTRVGVGNGTISITGTPYSPLTTLETISVVINSATGGSAGAGSFTVIGSVSGIIGQGSVNVPFTGSGLSFTVVSGSVAFSVDDYFQFNLINVATLTSTVSANGTMTGLTINQPNGLNPNTYPLNMSTSDHVTVTFTSPTAFTVDGTSSLTALGLPAGTVGQLYTGGGFFSFTINAGTTPFAPGDTFTFIVSSYSRFNPLGANDAAKRVAITTALAAELNMNADIRSELYEYNLIVCPGYPEVVENMLALTDAINDEAFVIGDTPCYLTPEQTATWSLSTARATSQNVAYYYPWALTTNLDGNSVLAAPSGIALRTYAFSDNQAYVWFAPAGLSRGAITGVNDVGYVSGTLGTATTFVPAHLNQGQRDNLYSYFKNINPIVFFPGNGLIIWGQKTSYGAASALDRVNVMRLLMYVKRQLRKGSFPFVFEPNDKVTRDNLKAAADGFLHDIMAKRGLYDFVTLCDTSNNTPDRIDRNELWLDVALKPVKAAEFIYIPIRVLATGAALP